MILARTSLYLKKKKNHVLGGPLYLTSTIIYVDLTDFYEALWIQNRWFFNSVFCDGSGNNDYHSCRKPAHA